MTPHDFLTALFGSETLAVADNHVTAYLQSLGERAAWLPIGRENNAGTIEAASDPGRSVVERITNAIDAILELEYANHRGQPQCRSPREAAVSWLNVPSAGLSSLSPAARRMLADRVILKVKNGEDRNSRTVEIQDAGIGILPQDIPKTILSLNESNKLRKPYLAGAYGQGGSSTFAVSKLTLIVSRHLGSDVLGYTLVRYEETPPEDYAKLGRYVYLVVDDSILSVDADRFRISHGTTIRHWGYDLSTYPSPLGPNSVYGLLNQILFDPVLPIWFDNGVHHYRRVIKGSRNALNGATDDGDDTPSRGDLDHSMPLFHVELGVDSGRIGVEYWVLKAPTNENKKPSAAFSNPVKPIILTINGQNHAELSQGYIKKEAELPYLNNRVIVHVDCNALTSQTKKSLFVSNREDVRRGHAYGLLISEIVRILKSDEKLAQLNEEARQLGLRQRDENEVQQIRHEVARLLRMQGINVAQGAGGSVRGMGVDAPGPRPLGPPRPPPPPLTPIPFVEPPTFVRIVGDGSPIRFFPGQRRYIRVETDAHSRYHDSTNRDRSRLNFMGTENVLSCRGATNLIGGRMRVLFECASEAQIGTTGAIRVELRRENLPTLFVEHAVSIVSQPPTRPANTMAMLPPFQVTAVSGPDNPKWSTLDWPDNIEEIASSAHMEGETLQIYYSERFPKFYATRDSLQRRDEEIAVSFTKRYEIWLAVHSLMLKESADRIRNQTEPDENLAEDWERQERCRMANVAALFALREVSAIPDTNE